VSGEAAHYRAGAAGVQPNAHVVVATGFNREVATIRQSGVVVVAGGGLSGCDAALELAGQGHNVTIVELADEIARDMIVINRITLLRELAEKGVRILTGHTVTAVDADGLTATGPGGAVHVAASTVIAAFGVRPNTALTLALSGRANVHPLGDCVHPAKVGEAVNAAFMTALVL